MPTTNLLRLLHLADSALPIGGAAHSYGLETLTGAGLILPAQVGDFLGDYLAEAGAVEAACCRRGHDLGLRLEETEEAAGIDAWLALNHECSALSLARESRQASLKLGNRLLHLVCDLEEDARLRTLLHQAEASGAGAHHACVFGLVGGRLGLAVEDVVAACLRQLAAGLVAASQKLMPLGQHQAAVIQWQLYTQIAAIATAQCGQDPGMPPPLLPSSKSPACATQPWVCASSSVD